MYTSSLKSDLKIDTAYNNYEFVLNFRVLSLVFELFKSDELSRTFKFYEDFLSLC